MKSDAKTVHLKTRWTPAEIPLSEYPRPQMVRKSYLNLNGTWCYAITDGADYTSPDGTILVPYSPECLLSGVMRTLQPNETLWYRRSVSIPDEWKDKKVLLHFGAVDRDCEVFINGVSVGTHQGGYNEFTFDVSGALNFGENELKVAVRDATDVGYGTRSKQTFRRGGIWYSPSSGIWQTVWMEAVPERYIERLEILPDFDGASVTVRAFGAGIGKIRVAVTDGTAARIGFEAGAEVLSEAEGEGSVTVSLGSFEAWSPECPKLYGLTVTTDFDTVWSYFGMRKFEVKSDCNKIPRFFLNGKPYFMHGLLDQGYYSDGMYTAPHDDALIFDIETAKRLGYNTLRKHIKVEPQRWYYHADRLGVLVMQDMPSGGERYKNSVIGVLPFIGVRLDDSDYKRFGRAEAESREMFLREYAEMLQNLRNAVSIAVWVPFNEGWGQFDANKAAALTRKSDPSRLVDHASGWHDQDGGDFNSLHVYFRPVRKIKAERCRAMILSEFGGYSLKADGHCFNPQKTFGYKIFKDGEKLNRAFLKLYRKDVVSHIAEGLSADIYTELSDVEDEVNGIMTYDREKVKITETVGEEVRSMIEKAFCAAVGEPFEKKKNRR